jgi:hypothetical protein
VNASINKKSPGKRLERKDKTEKVKINSFHPGEVCTLKNTPPGSKVWIQDQSSNTDCDVIIKNNIVVCKKTDLVQGRQVVRVNFYF